MSGMLVLTITVGTEPPHTDDDCEQVEFLAVVRSALEASPQFVERYADRLVGLVVPQTMDANSSAYRSAFRVSKEVRV